MRVFNDFDELKAAIGIEVGVSDRIEITQERINRFAETTGDEQFEGGKRPACVAEVIGQHYR